MKFINNISEGFKSLAVWLPTVLTFILVILEAAVQIQVIPVTWMPVVVFISGFIGRIIKQPSLKE